MRGSGPRRGISDQRYLMLAGPKAVPPDSPPVCWAAWAVISSAAVSVAVCRRADGAGHVRRGEHAERQRLLTVPSLACTVSW